MNLTKKVGAVLLGSCVLFSAMPLTAVSAADPDTETVSAHITLDDAGITADSENVTVEGNKVTITASGAYDITGTLSDGQIIVNVPDEVADPGTVQLYFDSVNLTGVSEAPVYVVNAEKTSINLVEGTENYLYDGETYTETTAVIYAKDDITIKGEGSLRIEASYQQGLHCNNDVKITGGKIKVKTLVGDAVRGKTSVEIKGGAIDINSAGDGIKSTKGDVLISGGEIEVKAANDAVQGETSVQISGGSLKANGDRGLTNAAGAVTITGGTVLATATDYQVAGVTEDETTQASVLFHTTTEQVKDQLIALNAADGTEIFSMNPDKKFDYVLISAPELTTGSDYSLLINGTEVAAFTQSGVITVLEDVTVPDVVSPDQQYDIDGSGTAEIMDAIMLARIVAEDQSLNVPDGALTRADVNGDSLITVDDLTAMLNYLAGVR